MGKGNREYRSERSGARDAQCLPPRSYEKLESRVHRKVQALVRGGTDRKGLLTQNLAGRLLYNILAAGLAVAACGEAVRPGAVKTKPGKPQRSRKAPQR